MRFINNARKCPRSTEILLSVQELENALTTIVQTIQQEDFKEDLRHLKNQKTVSSSSSLSNLTPFLDKNGIMRISGRLNAAHISYDAKHPMIIPYNGPIAMLLMLMIHKEILHCGPQALLAHTRQRFLPIKAKSMARSIVHNCVTCTKLKPKLLNQIMGNLP